MNEIIILLASWQFLGQWLCFTDFLHGENFNAFQNISPDAISEMSGGKKRLLVWQVALSIRFFSICQTVRFLSILYVKQWDAWEEEVTGVAGAPGHHLPLPPRHQPPRHRLLYQGLHDCLHFSFHFGAKKCPFPGTLKPRKSGRGAEEVVGLIDLGALNETTRRERETTQSLPPLPLRGWFKCYLPKWICKIET